MDVYEGVCNAIGPPQEGFYQIPVSRKQRVTHRKQYIPARIYRPVPLDPDTGEVLDRYPQLVGEINGVEADYRRVWAFGEKIGKGEYEWLRAITPLRTFINV